jgi:hypothetical protein
MSDNNQTRSQTIFGKDAGKNLISPEHPKTKRISLSLNYKKLSTELVANNCSMTAIRQQQSR